MRLAIKLINADADVNCLRHLTQLQIAQGETVEVMIQLVDADQGNFRYIPEPGAVVTMTLPRMDKVEPASNNTRVTSNPTIEREAVQAFPGDASIWKVPLTSAETQKLVSSSLKVTITEGSNIKIATLQRAIVIMDQQ